MAQFKLYNYFRSSASYRVRIALHWKGIAFEYAAVHLIKNGGEQHSHEYRRLNPMGHVPTLVHGDFVLAESMAIFDYLDRVHPEKPLFPSDAKLRGRAIQIAEVVNSGIQPYQNLKVLADFEKNHAWDKNKREDWLRGWVTAGLSNLENLLSQSAGLYAVGDSVSAADMFIVPQCFSTQRFNIDLATYPTLLRVWKTAERLPEFQKAHPVEQPDFEK